ncbi:hypothetical protein HDU77_003261 [Chytriomyces hyalinus]|nr:hypothetical protein HDU77_003261 [Chytriomyces hyalinus]
MTTFWGHVVDVVDAEVLVEAVVAGVLPEFGSRVMDYTAGEEGLVCIRLGSGTVFVWEDSEKLTRTVLQKMLPICMKAKQPYPTL